MLPHDQQFCTFEQAKILKAAGVKQKSHWYYQFNGHKAFLRIYSPGISDPNESSMYSAFSVGELGHILPAVVSDSTNEYRFFETRDGTMYTVGYTTEGRALFIAKGSPEAEARAAALIELLRFELPVSLINQSI